MNNFLNLSTAGLFIPDQSGQNTLSWDDYLKLIQGEPTTTQSILDYIFFNVNPVTGNCTDKIGNNNFVPYGVLIKNGENNICVGPSLGPSVCFNTIQQDPDISIKASFNNSYTQCASGDGSCSSWGYTCSFYGKNPLQPALISQENWLGNLYELSTLVQNISDNFNIICGGQPCIDTKNSNTINLAKTLTPICIETESISCSDARNKLCPLVYSNIDNIPGPYNSQNVINLQNLINKCYGNYQFVIQQDNFCADNPEACANIELSMENFCNNHIESPYCDCLNRDKTSNCTDTNMNQRCIYNSIIGPSGSDPALAGAPPQCWYSPCRSDGNSLIPPKLFVKPGICPDICEAIVNITGDRINSLVIKNIIINQNCGSNAKKLVGLDSKQEIKETKNSYNTVIIIIIVIFLIVLLVFILLIYFLNKNKSNGR